MTCLVPSQNISDAILKPNVCDNKCSLNYNYNNTNLLVTQDKVTGYYNFKSDIEKAPSVEYNSTKYAATGFNLYNGPVHNYGNPSINAEIIIMHKKSGSHNDSNEENLCICIPVVISDGGGSILDMVMTALSNAMDGKQIPQYPFTSDVCEKNPTDNSCGITINPENFNLGNLIPEQNYIVYAGSDIMNDSCSSTNNTRYIIFNNSNPTKMLTLSTTQSSNTNFDKFSKSTTKQHYNTSDKGPDGGFQQYPYNPGETMEDNIFIDCKPVVTSETKEKNTYVTIGTPAFLSKISFTQILGYVSDYIPTVVGVILMIILWKLGNYLYGPKCPGNNCEPPLEKLKCPVNIKPK